MASPAIDSAWLSSPSEPFCKSLNVGEAHPADILPVLEAPFSKRPLDDIVVPKETKDAWDNLFKEGYGADVCILTNEKSCVLAHSNVLSIASPVLANVLRLSKVKNGMRYIKIPGVPHGAVCMFIRFLYSSCYEEEELQKFVLHLLVLSHFYSIPSLKRVCICSLEQGWLTRENVIDVLQLARNCDAPRLAFICVRMVVKNFQSISLTEGWRAMRRANPALEQELVESVVEADTKAREAEKNGREKSLLAIARSNEALLHISKDCCRTIGPRGKVLKGSQGACNFPACKRLETLVRHFSNCKTRVPGGCDHCKRMWQLLELHSRMCNEPDSCKVPLCRHFKEKMQQQSKKDETKWKVLVSKVIAAKNAVGSFSSRSKGLF
ncbi:hypothetical protein V6Z12_D05G357600 [Gossypium hirsutum]